MSTSPYGAGGWLLLITFFLSTLNYVGSFCKSVFSHRIGAQTRGLVPDQRYLINSEAGYCSRANSITCEAVTGRAASSGCTFCH